jgi:hypothetical protein
MAGLDPANQPPRVGAARESFRLRTLATGWPALRPAMVIKINPKQLWMGAEPAHPPAIFFKPCFKYSGSLAACSDRWAA